MDTLPTLFEILPSASSETVLVDCRPAASSGWSVPVRGRVEMLAVELAYCQCCASLGSIGIGRLALGDG